MNVQASWDKQLFLSFLLWFTFSCSCCWGESQAQDAFPSSTYHILGVSGTLQEGFPLRSRLDYSEDARAIFLGTAMVRGYKAYLDVKRPGCREYVPKVSADGVDHDGSTPPSPPHVPNAVVMPTGCWHDANIYHIYAVDSRQVLEILAGEPRYLAITPDTGLIELNNDDNNYTNTTMFAALCQQEMQKKKKHQVLLTNTTHVAIPLVTGVWFDQDSFVPSPMVHVLSDGTRVTSYQQSLELWANIKYPLVSSSSGCNVAHQEHTCKQEDVCGERNKSWQLLYNKIRTTEASYSSSLEPQMSCHPSQVRFGVGPEHLRMNYALTRQDIERIVLP